MIPPARGVAPFGHPWITACSRLPRAFRSVPRPSSPPSAKASTRCPSRARPNPLAKDPPAQRQNAPLRAHPIAPAMERRSSEPATASLSSAHQQHRDCVSAQIQRLCLCTDVPLHTLDAPDAHRTAPSQDLPQDAGQTPALPRAPRAPQPQFTPQRPHHTPQAAAPLPHKERTPPQGAPKPPPQRTRPKAATQPGDDQPGGEQPGDDRDRTGDPLLAKQVLSQLSYAPEDQKPDQSRWRRPPGDRHL